MMDPLVAFALAFAVLFVGLTVRIPIGVMLGVAGTIGIILVDGVDIAATTLSRLPYSQGARYILLVLPFFIAMAYFARDSGLAERAYGLLSRVLVRVPGGIPIATVMSCGLFAAVSGSSAATVAAMGSLSIKEMRRNGYTDTFAAGVVSVASTLGILIPPSVALVLYGVISGESIGALLMAGIIPGILSAVAYILAIYYWARRGSAAVLREPGKKPVIRTDVSLREGLGAIGVIGVVFAVVMGGIYTGLLTTTEAAAAGALMLLVSVVVRGRHYVGGGFAQAWRSMREAVELNSSIFVLLIGGGIFTFFLVISGVPQQLTNAIVASDIPGWAVVVAFLLVLVPMGMFIDGLSMLMIAVPLMHPVVTGLGYDGIWFAILVIKLIEIGLITPPLGMNVFIVATVDDAITPEIGFRGVLRLGVVEVFVIILLFMVPAIVTWLPNQVQ